MLEGGRHWLAIGFGLKAGDAGFRVLDCQDWDDVVRPSAPDLASLDGHFVLLRWSGRRIEAFVDQLGTRTLYLKPYRDGIIFSTRLDHLASILGGLEIDFAVFGAQWMIFNQLSAQSPVHGLERLGAGGHAEFDCGRLRITEQAWTPDIDESDRTGSIFAQRLGAMLRPEGPSKLSLGLSGGLDSRLLLALSPPCASTHVFGAADHPDTRISNAIARKEALPHLHLDHTVPDIDECLDLLFCTVAASQTIAPASSVLSRNNPAALHAAGYTMIDGALGEAARRQFMNRLRWFGKGATRPVDILPHLRIERFGCFAQQAQQLMTDGTLYQIDASWAAIPKELHYENRLDLIGVRSRLPNFFGLEQQRLDGLLECFMPFAQPSVLRRVFRMPLSLRRSGRLFRRLIRARRPSLARHQLVKDNVAYPYWISGPGVHLVCAASKQIGRQYHGTQRKEFLLVLKSFVLDTLHSQDVQTYAPYETAVLASIVESYYRGDVKNAGALDWWLSFETWRRVLKGNGTM